MTAPRAAAVVVASLLDFLFFLKSPKSRKFLFFSILATDRVRVSAALLARSRLFLQKVALGFPCLSRLLEPIRESTRFALDAYSYLRYLRFSVFYELAVSPLSF